MRNRLIVSTDELTEKGRTIRHTFGMESPELSVPENHTVTGVRKNGTFTFAAVLGKQGRDALTAAVRPVRKVRN